MGRSRRTRKAQPDTPFSEEQARLPYENFYYVQEDILFEAAERDGVHLVGASAAHPDRLGARERDEHGGDARRLCGRSAARRGAAFRFPGSREQWEAVTDVTDAGLLADHLVWAATTPAAANQALNIVNGDVFRWRRMWPRLAAALGSSRFRSSGEPAAARAADGRRGARCGPRSCAATACATSNVERLASWWHTDADLGRTIETFTDMGRSRRLGFLGVRDSEILVHRSLLAPAAERIVP